MSDGMRVNGLLPCRTPLDCPEAARVTPVRSMLDRIDKFTARTGIKISAPYNNASGKWEVSGPDGTTAHDNGHRMMDELENRNPS
jgi:hypothetical protein